MPLSGSGTGSYYYPVMQAPQGLPIASPINYIASATFTGEAYSVVAGPYDVSRWRDFAITLINNSVNNLKSGSVEISYDGTNWTTLNTTAFSPLTSSGAATLTISSEFTASIYRGMRVRGWASGSAGGITGSLNVIILGRN